MRKMNIVDDSGRERPILSYFGDCEPGDYVWLEDYFPFHKRYIGCVVDKINRNSITMEDAIKYKKNKFIIRYKKKGEERYCIARVISDPDGSDMVMYFWKKDIEYKE